jgi:hypothetical protein
MRQALHASQQRTAVALPRRLMTCRAQAVGSKLEPYLATPFDVLAFGPRTTVGALLTAPQRLGALQADVQRLVDLVQASPEPHCL